MRITWPTMRAFSVALVAVASTSGIAEAQQPTLRRFELTSFMGALVPTGVQSNTLKNAPTLGLQGAYAFNRYLSAVGTFSWASSEDKTAFTDQDVDVFQYDIGAEAGIEKQLTSAFTLRPFVGLGMGGRAYDYNDRDTESQYNFAGYGAGGAELMMGRFGWRV